VISVANKICSKGKRYDVTDSQQPIIVNKNRTRAIWSLVIIVFFVPISAWLVVLGLHPGRPDVSWSLVMFGLLGVVAFGGSAVLIVRTMRAPWHLEVNPSYLALYTPTYDLEVPWDHIAGIAVDEVSRRPGCVLIFEDVPALVQRARFHGRASRPDAVTNARTMQARMEENLNTLGYHLGIPGRILELGPEELAELLARACTGGLWAEESSQ
jgi:hypothetical protein